jgi:hypothetical protein
MNRELTSAEERLIRWMLEHGSPDARSFPPQIERAQATPYQCCCGCASINLSVDGLEKPIGGMGILGDFVFGSEENLSGIFVFEQSGFLAGLEVYGLAGDAPTMLPSPELLRPF